MSPVETEKNRVRDIDTAMTRLAQLRDELRLKMHLARADARDEWEKLEDRWPDLERRVEGLGNAAEEAAADVRLGIEKLVDELGEAYRKLRRSL